MADSYYCHCCQRRIQTISQDFTCPVCSNGFIEIVDNPQSHNSYYDNDYVSDEDYDENYGGIYSNQPLDTPNSSSAATIATTAATSSGRNSLATGNNRDDFNNINISIDHNNPNSINNRGLRRTRISIRRVAPDNQPTRDGDRFMQSFFQQFLNSLLGNNNIGFTNINNTTPFQFNPNDFVWTRGGLDNIITMFMNQLENTGPPPATKATIDQLPMVTIQQQHIEKSVQCHVCMEDFVVLEKVIQLPCKHLYHLNCIVPWLELHGTCPICRQTVDIATTTTTTTTTTTSTTTTTTINSFYTTTTTTNSLSTSLSSASPISITTNNFFHPLATVPLTTLFNNVFASINNTNNIITSNNNIINNTNTSISSTSNSTSNSTTTTTSSSSSSSSSNNTNDTNSFLDLNLD